MKIKQIRDELKKGCGKEVTGDDHDDYNCGDDFPDDDGTPWVAYCPECNATLQLLDKITSAIIEDVERLNPDLLAYWHKEYEEMMDKKSSMEICNEDNDINKFIMDKFKEELIKNLKEAGE